MIEVTQLKAAIAELEKTPRELEGRLNGLLAAIPNLPLPEVPDGSDEHGNVQRHVFGQARSYGFAPKAHDDLGGALGFMDFETAAKLSGARFVVLKKGLARMERAIGQFMLDLHTNEHGQMDFERAAKVSGARFVYLKGDLAKLERALGAFMLDTHTEKFGYTEVNPPLLVREQTAYGTGNLPKSAEDMFCTREGLWLIPTAEMPLTNLVRESIVDEKELPMRLTALTPCFRAEAGAAGRDTRGMIRQHQFTKVELVSITTPETSKDEHERMLACAEEVLRQLDLHYRVMTLCAGDMGFAAQKTYDIEVWLPGQGEGGAYREISSCSVCGDFQARRMDARYRGGDGKPRFVHTLNGSGTAVGRALIAVMETYQQQDGSIAVPDVLQPYMGGLKVIEREK